MSGNRLPSQNVHVCILARKRLAFHTRVFRQAKTLGQHGYRVTIISPKEKGFPAVERTQWYEHHRIHPVIPFCGAGFSPPTPVPMSVRLLGSGLAKLGSGLAGVKNAVARLPRRRARAPQPQRETSPGDIEGAGSDEPDRGGAATLPAGAESSPRGLESMRERLLRMGAVKLVLELAFFSNAMVKALRRPATVYHAHDSYPLIVGYTLARLHRAKLVYDAVEVAFDRGRTPMREKGRARHWLERFVVRRADAVFATANGHAQLVADHYGIDKPTVLMNCREYECPSPSTGLRQLAGNRGIALYSGSITGDYGLHALVESALYLDDIAVFVIGPEVMIGYRNELRKLIRRLGVNDRVFLMDPVGRNEVLALVASADVGVIPPPRRILNFSNALPNKLFDYIMARLPVVSYATPDIRKVVESHDIGVVLGHDSPEAIAEAINEVFERREHYRTNLESIAPLYCWEVESRKMTDVYGCLQ